MAVVPELKVMPIPSNRIRDITGIAYGSLIVVGFVSINKGCSRWLCQCSCGAMKVVPLPNLISGGTRSCGCWHREQKRKMKTTHGLNKHPLYHTWDQMIRRCYSENAHDYKNYGARGIVVCDQWRESVATFIRDIETILGLRPKGATLDRKNNDGGYEPTNVQWASSKQQHRNTRANRIIQIDGESKTLAEWAEVSGVSSACISSRIKSGWAAREAVFTSVRKVSR